MRINLHWQVKKIPGDSSLRVEITSYSSYFGLVSTSAASAAIVISPGLSWACLINSNRSAVNLSSIQRIHCFLGLLLIRHLHETETFRSAGVAVSYYSGCIHFAILREHGTQFVIIDVITEISNVNFHLLSSLYLGDQFFLLGICPMGGYNI